MVEMCAIQRNDCNVPEEYWFSSNARFGEDFLYRPLVILRFRASFPFGTFVLCTQSLKNIPENYPEFLKCSSVKLRRSSLHLYLISLGFY